MPNKYSHIFKGHYIYPKIFKSFVLAELLKEKVCLSVVNGLTALLEC